MATTDNNIQYDERFFDELYQYAYAGRDAAHRAHLKEACSRGEIQIETLLENAIANHGGLTKDSTEGRDFTDGSDAKKVVSVCRTKYSAKRGYFDVNTYSVRGTENKTGTLRIMAWNKKQKKFDYFLIPHHAYKHQKFIEICLDPYSGRVGSGGQYYRYKVADFTGITK